jgi:ParB family chromosome partitioning protein
MSNLTRTDEAARQRLASMTAADHDAPPPPSVTTRYTGTKAIRAALEVRLDRIERDEAQPRTEFDPEALDRLAESIKARGVLQPIRVRWDEGRGVYVVVVGERRWRAAKAAGLATIPCVVAETDITPEDRLEDQLVENALREDLKPVEQAKAFRRLMDAHGWSGNQVSRELAVDASVVSRALALLQLPESVQAKVDSGDLAARAAAEISRLPDPAEQLALAEQAAAGGLKIDQVQATVKARRLGKAKAEPGGKREFKFPDGAKVAVTLPPGTAGTPAYVEMLQRALKELRAELKQATPGRAGEAA